VAAVTRRVRARIERDFPDVVDAAAVTRRVSEMDESERVQAAVVLAARGDVARVEALINLAKQDWRDALVGGGLESATWPVTLATEFGPDVDAPAVTVRVTFSAGTRRSCPWPFGILTIDLGRLDLRAPGWRWWTPEGSLDPQQVLRISPSFVLGTATFRVALVDGSRPWLIHTSGHRRSKAVVLGLANCGFPVDVPA